MMIRAAFAGALRATGVVLVSALPSLAQEPAPSPSPEPRTASPGEATPKPAEPDSKPGLPSVRAGKRRTIRGYGNNLLYNFPFNFPSSGALSSVLSPALHSGTFELLAATKPPGGWG